MADLKISELTSANLPLGGGEELPIVQGGVTKKTIVSNLLSNFTDALNLKEDKANKGYLMGNFYKKIYNQKSGIDQVKWLTFGDSYAQLIYAQIAPILLKMTGNNIAGSYFSGSFFGITNNGSTGTITNNAADFESWVTGITLSLSTGATQTYGIIGSPAFATKIKIYYVIEPAGGTFKVQVNGVDAVGYENVSAVGTLGTLGVVTITQSRTLSEWTVVNLTGTVKIIGTGFEDSTVSGLTTINISQGGIPLGGSLNSITGYSTALSNFNQFLADVNPTVFSFEMKENSSYFDTALNTLFTGIDSDLSNTDVLLIGSTPMAIADADQVIQNTQLETIAKIFNYQYYDTYLIFKNYTGLTNLGWEGDGTHVSVEANQYRGKRMLMDLGIFSETEINASNTVNDSVVTRLLNVIGTTGNIATISSPGNTEATIRTTGTTGQSAKLNLITGFSGLYGNSYIESVMAELKLFASSLGGTSSRITLYTAGGEKVRITNTGDTGFGTTVPTQKLDVNGIGRLRTALTIDVNGITSINNSIRNDGAYLIYKDNLGAEFQVIHGKTNGDYINIGLQAGGQTALETAIGKYAGYGNTGLSLTAIGGFAGFGNTAENLTAIGKYAGFGNTGIDLTAIGPEAGLNNTGTVVTAIGNKACYNNTGTIVTAIGDQACFNNTGSYVNAIGDYTGMGNTGSYVNAIGYSAGILNGKSNATIINNIALPSYADRAAAVADLTTVNGCVTGNTYLYYNATTFAIEGVRL